MHSFVYTAVPWSIGTVTDFFIGGLLADYLIRRGFGASAVRRVILVGGIGFGLGIYGAAYASTPALALFWISVSLGGLAASAPIAWSLPSLIASPENVGKVGGIINFFGQVSAIAAPIVTGYVVQFRHSYSWAFLAAAIYLVIGIVAYVFLLGRIERTAHT